MSTRIGGRKLTELSDEELRSEATRRRKLRTGGQSMPAEMKRYFASLELAETATRDEVEDAYVRLIEKYDPEKRRGDAKKFEAAKELSRSLSRAYRRLSDWFEKN
ncbi:MAG: DnaJ-domain-containing protein 1 [Polyangiales bacterium]|jgi:DnaJ-domain-containing protein 1